MAITNQESFEKYQSALEEIEEIMGSGQLSAGERVMFGRLRRILLNEINRLIEQRLQNSSARYSGPVGNFAMILKRFLK